MGRGQRGGGGGKRGGDEEGMKRGEGRGDRWAGRNGAVRAVTPVNDP